MSNCKLSGVEALAKALYVKSEIDFEEVCLKNTTRLFNAAKKNTPTDTGKLKDSLRMTPPAGSDSGEVGYTREYAPHVEYGHRTVCGGYVQGQHFLQRSLEEVQPQFLADCKKELGK